MERARAVGFVLAVFVVAGGCAGSIDPGDDPDPADAGPREPAHRCCLNEMFYACGNDTDAVQCEETIDQSSLCTWEGEWDEVCHDEAVLLSGNYITESGQFTDNNCGIDYNGYFPKNSTLETSPRAIRVVGLDEGEVDDDGEFRFQNEYEVNYGPEGYVCTLEFRTDFRGTIRSRTEAEIEFFIDIDEVPLADDDDCPTVASEVLGLTSWEPIIGCSIDGVFTLSQ